MIANIVRRNATDLCIHFPLSILYGVLKGGIILKRSLLLVSSTLPQKIVSQAIIDTTLVTQILAAFQKFR